MKQILYLCLIVLFLGACKKNNDTSINPPPPPSGGDTSNNVPASTPVSSTVILYVDNNQGSNPYSVRYGTGYLNYTNYGFNSGIINSEKYYTGIVATPQLTITSYETMGHEVVKILNLSGTVKNYGDIKLPTFTNVGSTLYDYGTGTFNLPNNGSISIPAYCYTPTNGGPVSFSIIANYLNPSVTDYAAMMPTLIADENNKRYFLDSYGNYIIRVRASDNTESSIDFKSTAVVPVKIAIPTYLAASAPDSIPTWNFNLVNGVYKWQRNGYAQKSGNFYQKNINKKGYWNFAIPVEACYVTLHLKTQTDNLPVANTRFKIKSGATEIADGRTDSEGNALVLVPKNRSLDIELRDDHISLWESAISIVQSFGSFSARSEKTILLSNRYDLSVLEGNVFNCNGSAFSNGYAVLMTGAPKSHYTIPIVNGKFKTSFWATSGGAQECYLDIYDNNNTQLIHNSVMVTIADGPPGDLTYYSNQNINFYTCLNATKVYSNFKIDAIASSVAGESTDPSPKVTCDYRHTVSPFDIITIDNNGSPISFRGNFVFGAYTQFVNEGLIINGASCTFDTFHGDNKIILTRGDTTPGGFIEGFVSIHYKDPNNVYHTFKGNFRAKRLG